MKKRKTTVRADLPFKAMLTCLQVLPDESVASALRNESLFGNAPLDVSPPKLSAD